MSELEPTRTYSNPTAADILRRMLDERGVEWDYGITGSTTTRFNVNGIDLTFTPMRDGLVCSTILTPEQAIAATMGAGTCHVWAYVKWDWDRCEPYWEHDLSCGHTVMTMEPVPPRYCPNCGRKVVDE